MRARQSAALLRLAAIVSMAWAVVVLVAAPTIAVDGLNEITSSGPLTRIITTSELNCQVAHREDAAFELFGDETGACGTFLAVEGTLYGPSSVPSGVSPTQAWVPVSQSAVTGSGSASDPFRIVTVVAAPAAGLRIEQVDSYVSGSEAYTTEVTITNTGPAARSGILYRAARDADPAAEGRAKAVATSVVLATAVVAWVGLALMRAEGGPVDLAGAALETAGATVVVAGFEAAAFAMLPLRFLPGAAVFAWDRRAWALLLGLGVAGFVHVLLNPTTGYLADDTRTSFLTLVLLLAGFAVVSVLFWAYFRFRRSPAPAT